MKKRVLIGVSLGVVVALLATVLVLALVNKSYKPEFDLQPKTAYIVEVSTDDRYETGVAFSNKEKFEKINDLFNKSFEQSILGGIFTGKISNKVECEAPVKSLPSFSDGYQITFEFKADMELKYYKANSDDKIVFQTLIVNITDTQGYQELSMYAKEVVSNQTYYYEITSIANTENLYDYLSQIDYQ